MHTYIRSESLYLVRLNHLSPSLFIFIFFSLSLLSYAIIPLTLLSQSIGQAYLSDTLHIPSPSLPPPP